MPLTGAEAPAAAAERRLLSYFTAVEAAFAAAADRAGGARTVSLALAGQRLALRFAGPALQERLLPALAHLPAAPGGAHATVLLFDSASTGVAVPRPGWEFDGKVVRGQIAGLTGESIFTALEPSYGGFSLYDPRRRLGIYHAPDAAAVPHFEASFPLRTILNWDLGAVGLQIVHAGAVGTDRGGVLLVGKGGSGKSSTSLKCLCAGLRFAGDDYVLTGSGSPPQVFSLYSSAKLFPEDAGHFPELAAARRLRAEESPEKDLYFLHDAWRGRIAAALPLRALLLPRVGGAGPTRATLVSAATALAAMAPSTLFQLPGAGAAAFGAMAELTRRVPAFRLELGEDREAVPAAVAALLEEIGPLPTTVSAAPPEVGRP